MNDLEIRRVDPFDEATLAAWHAVYHSAERHGREQYATPWALEELRAQVQTPSRRRTSAYFVGLLAGEAVVSGSVVVPLPDNLTQAELYVTTLPEHRRRGLGSAMLEVLEQAMGEHGRTVASSETAWAYDLGPTGAGSAGLEFATAHGFRLGLGDVQRRLVLPVADALLDELAAEAAPHHAGYELRSWVGMVPDELLQGWAELSASLMTEAPTGDLLREVEVVDLDAVREGEVLGRRQGRTKYNTVALDPAGDVVAYTDIATTVHEPGRAYQWGTLVRRDQRGHRLGLAVKVANLRLLQREAPDADHVLTWNAEVNGHMIGVNERLGFAATERLGEFQKHLG